MAATPGAKSSLHLGPVVSSRSRPDSSKGTRQILVWGIQRKPFLTRIEGHLLSPTAVSAGWQIVGMGDVNQDGFTDLVWHHDTTGALAWWRLDGVAQVSGGPCRRAR